MTDIKNLWQSQKAENQMITLDDIRTRSGKFRIRIGRRNILIIGYSLFALIAFTRWFWVAFHRPVLPPVTLIIALMAAAAQFWILFALWWRGRARPLPDTLAGEAALDFHRHELERQRAATASAWAWYILPCMPPYVGLGWFLLRAPHITPPPVMLLLMVGIANLLFFGAILLAFSRSATRLQQELERLKRLRAE